MWVAAISFSSIACQSVILSPQRNGFDDSSLHFAVCPVRPFDRNINWKERVVLDYFLWAFDTVSPWETRLRRLSLPTDIQNLLSTNCHFFYHSCAKGPSALGVAPASTSWIQGVIRSMSLLNMPNVSRGASVSYGHQFPLSNPNLQWRLCVAVAWSCQRRLETCQILTKN